jgi:hypothetical protein
MPINLETAKNDKHISSVGFLAVNFPSRKLGASHFYSDSDGGWNETNTPL